MPSRIASSSLATGTKNKTMEMKITTLGFYPNRYWFFYFEKMKYIKGFTLRLLGFNVMVKEKDSLNKLLNIANINRLNKNTYI